MAELKKREILRRVWLLYLDACLCAADYGSHCECPATDDAATILRDAFGEKWHDKCRKRWPA